MHFVIAFILAYVAIGCIIQLVSSEKDKKDVLTHHLNANVLLLEDMGQKEGADKLRNNPKAVYPILALNILVWPINVILAIIIGLYLKFHK